jgi:hypothetical protein
MVIVNILLKEFCYNFTSVCLALGQEFISATAYDFPNSEQNKGLQAISDRLKWQL